MALGLGSNVGDRIGHLRDAVEGLSGPVEIVGVSSVYESAPVGYVDQPDFLNAVVVGRSELSPRRLLRLAHDLEERAGRGRPFPNAPRTLDVDILLRGEERIESVGLSVPHPRLLRRSFVLAPLAEVAGAWVDPVTGRTVEKLWEEHEDDLPPVRRHAPSSTIWRPSP